MAPDTLAALSDQLVYLTVLSYVVAAVLFGAELAYRSAWAGTAGMVVTVAGFAANVATSLTRGLAAGRVPWGNMYEFSLMIGNISVAVFLVWAFRRREVRPLGTFALLPAIFSIAIAGTSLHTTAGPLMPALQSGWLRIHVLAATAGMAILMVASVFSALYLLKSRAERRAAPRPPLVAGGAPTADEVAVGAAIKGYVDEEADATERTEAPRSRSFWDRLPSAKRLDDLAYRTTIFGFPIWTFAIIAGAVWAQSAWSRYWGWDPKETWSFIVWVIYAAYLHARATAGWRARGAAWISVAGLLALLVNYYAVNLIFSGLHSYSGL